MSVSSKNENLPVVSSENIPHEAHSTSQGNHFDTGSCSIIFGPMFSGKTTELARQVVECADIELSCLYINHTIDVRETEFFSSIVSSHSSGFKGISEKVECIKVSTLNNINIDNYDVIGIDEGQFFDDIVENVRDWVLNKNKKVIIASLDGKFNIETFGNVHRLICLCDPGGIRKLGARCKRCMLKTNTYRHYRLVPAGFTMRLVGGKSDVLVGGDDIYESVCLKCHKEHAK